MTLQSGDAVLVGDMLVSVPQLDEGDTVLPIAATGELVVISAAVRSVATEAVSQARAAFAQLQKDPRAQERITHFFKAFADNLANDETWKQIAATNVDDIARARAKGRPTNRLEATEKMRVDMIAGLREWAEMAPRVGGVAQRRETETFVIERRWAPLGVVAFIFEGRPNVCADGAGVLRNGNVAIMRIGADAFATGAAIEQLAIRPALESSGLPRAAVSILPTPERSAGQFLFSLRGVDLAVARGSGRAVKSLGSIAQQHGIPVSLHGTGGAWMYISPSASPQQVSNAIRASLDRKVCNTLNVLVLDKRAVSTLGPVVREALSELKAQVHVVAGSEGLVDQDCVVEKIATNGLASEWEWETQPECSFVIADGFDEACALINEHSPKFVASILTSQSDEFDRFYSSVEAPYVSNGFTRWVDGQWAWQRPELGLSNWENGRLLGRSGILVGDEMVTIRDVFLDKTGQASQSR